MAALLTLPLHIIRLPLVELQLAMRRGQASSEDVRAWFITRIWGFQAEDIDTRSFRAFVERTKGQVEVVE